MPPTNREYLVMSERKVGFIGLGTMGGAMCRHALKAGETVSVWARTAERAAGFLKDGAGWVESPAALAAECDVIVLCVTNDDAVEKVVFGEEGIAETQGAGKILLDHSSIHPVTTRQWAEKLKSDSGFSWVDAPVSGGPGGAARGELIVMAGGDPADFDSVRSLISCYAKQITFMGPSGSGQATKACNQLIIGAEICAIAEALNMAKNFGMNAQALADALKGGWADSAVLQDHGRRMATADFSDPADASMMMKDMDIASDLGRETGSPLPVTEIATALYRRAIDEGNLDGGQIAPIRLYRKEPL